MSEYATLAAFQPPFLRRGKSQQTFGSLASSSAYLSAPDDGIHYEIPEPDKFHEDPVLEQRVLRRLRQLKQPHKAAQMTVQAIAERQKMKHQLKNRVRNQMERIINAPLTIALVALVAAAIGWFMLGQKDKAAIIGALSGVLGMLLVSTLMAQQNGPLTLGPRKIAMSRFRALALQQLPQVGDGSCQFRSLSQQLFGDAIYHVSIRASIVDHMRQNIDMYLPFVLGNPLFLDFEDFLEDLSKPGTWGGEETLAAAANLYRVTIVVFNSNEDGNYLQEYRPSSPGEDPKKTAFLLYTAHPGSDIGHYDAFTAASTAARQCTE